MGLLVKRSVVDFRKHSGIFCNKFPDFWEGYQILLCVIQDLSKQMSGNSLAKEKLGGCESNQWPNIAVFWRQTQRKKASSNNPVARTTRLSYLHDLLLPDDIIKLNGFQNAKKSKNSLVKRRFIRCIYFANQKFKSNFEFSLKIAETSILYWIRLFQFLESFLLISSHWKEHFEILHKLTWNDEGCHLQNFLSNKLFNDIRIPPEKRYRSNIIAII